MNETDFFSMIICQWIEDYPGLSIEEAIEDLEFDEEEEFYAMKWYEKLFGQEYSEVLQ